MPHISTTLQVSEIIKTIFGWEKTIENVNYFSTHILENTPKCIFCKHACSHIYSQNITCAHPSTLEVNHEPLCLIYLPVSQTQCKGFELGTKNVKI